MLSGTSMACPHVSGMAALLLEEDSSMAPAQVKSTLQSTCNQDDGRIKFSVGFVARTWAAPNFTSSECPLSGSSGFSFPSLPGGTLLFNIIWGVLAFLLLVLVAGLVAWLWRSKYCQDPRCQVWMRFCDCFKKGRQCGGPDSSDSSSSSDSDAETGRPPPASPYVPLPVQVKPPPAAPAARTLVPVEKKPATPASSWWPATLLPGRGGAKPASPSPSSTQSARSPKHWWPSDAVLSSFEALSGPDWDATRASHPELAKDIESVYEVLRNPTRFENDSEDVFNTLRRNVRFCKDKDLDSVPGKLAVWTFLCMVAERSRFRRPLAVEVSKMLDASKPWSKAASSNREVAQKKRESLV